MLLQIWIHIMFSDQWPVTPHTFLIFSSKAKYGSGPASKLVSKLGIAAWCGLVGALFTFPGLRLARMHRDALTYNESSVLRSVFVIIPSPPRTKQCWGYVTYWCGSGSADPYL
jgi:hypothetical protein